MPRARGVGSALAAIASAARDAGLRWYVFGAQAVALHGHARATADIDVTIEAPRDLAVLVASLVAHDIHPTVPDAASFVARSRVLPCLHRPSGLPVDVVLAGPGLEAAFLDRATSVRVGRTRVPILSLSDLLVTKAIAGRPKDLDDIEALVRIHRGTLDLDGTIRVVEEVGDAIGEDLASPVLRRLGR
jgi:hypothetical protein